MGQSKEAPIPLYQNPTSGIHYFKSKGGNPLAIAFRVQGGPFRLPSFYRFRGQPKEAGAIFILDLGKVYIAAGAIYGF